MIDKQKFFSGTAVVGGIRFQPSTGEFVVMPSAEQIMGLPDFPDIVIFLVESHNSLVRRVRILEGDLAP